MQSLALECQVLKVPLLNVYWLITKSPVTFCKSKGSVKCDHLLLHLCFSLFWFFFKIS